MAFSLLKKISPVGWITLTAVVLILASAIGMICIDQDNRATMEECNKRINSCPLNPNSPEMKADAPSIHSALYGESPPETELGTGTSDRTLTPSTVPPEKRETATFSR
jgi:hypothetical protein